MNTSTLIVKDSEFHEAAQQFQAYCRVLESTISNYHTAMTRVATETVPSGAVHDAIECYLAYIVELESMVKDLGARCTKITSNFISELEQADDYLYDAGISDIARDFSDEEYQHLVNCLTDTWCSGTDSFGDWILKNINSVVDFFNWDSAKAYLQQCRRLLLDYNDATAATLKTLFEAVKAVDRKYGHSIAGGVGNGDFYTSNFATISLCMYCTRDLLNKMAEVINPKNGSFTVSRINDQLGDAFAELKMYYDKLIEIKGTNEQPTISEISDFANQKWTGSYFSSYFQPVSTYIAELGGWDAFKMIVFNMFGIAKDKLLLGDYDEYLIKIHLMEVLKDMVENYDYPESAEQESVSQAKTFLDYYKKFGKNWYEYMNTHRGEDGKLLLDGRTKEAKAFKKFLDSLGNAGDILKYGSKGVDYLAQLFADYQKGQSVLESFARNYSGDDKILNAVEQIQALYSKEFGAWAEKAIVEIEKIGIDEGLSLLAKKVPVVAVVSAIEKVLDTGGELTGVGTEAKGMYDALVYIQLYSSSNTAFSQALEKFRAADPNSAEYETLARDLENCYNLNKNNIVAMYKAMEKGSSGDKQAYYHYCAQQAERMSIHDTIQPNLLSFEEFLALNG